MVEIAPAPGLDSSICEKLYAYALKAAKEVCYTNAGTIEFILDENNQPYFLEMNTRLQVEHPITEQITGIDIVQEQIRIASGERLAMTQEQITRNGYAIGFRSMLKIPKMIFCPALVELHVIMRQEAVRTDSAIYTGYKIPPDYDSLCAKLTVWALDWPSVLRRARRALDEMRMFGVKTTIPFYLEMIKSEEFQQGVFTTGNRGSPRMVEVFQ